MGNLRLILGPAGSGKTTAILTELAAEAARAPLVSVDAPPLILLVPEQQAAQMERAVLEHLGAGTSARIQVLSFNWLARRLELAAGRNSGELSAGGRRLLVWRLLGDIDAQRFADASVRSEYAALLSALLGELAQHAASSADLSQRAVALTAHDPRLSDKAHLLADIAQRVEAYCQQHTLNFHAPAARIPALLSDDNWPLLSGSRVYVDGFSGFTRAEEQALVALLQHCASVTCALLLDPARIEGPLDSDSYDWYAPSREQYVRWQELAQRAGVEFDAARDVTLLQESRRWPAGHAIRVLAEGGLQAVALDQQNQECVTDPAGFASRRARPSDAKGVGDVPSPPPSQSSEQHCVTAVICTDERAEAEAAAREVRRLTLPCELGGGGLHYGQISIALRSLAPYADLLALSLTRLRIPHFIDRRRVIAHHPACTLLRSGLRLALGTAERDDVHALLKCGLLGLQSAGQLAPAEALRRSDVLENYSLATALTPEAWLNAETWSRWPNLEDDALHILELDELDSWRRELLAPVIELRKKLTELQPHELTIRAVLEHTWRCLFTNEVSDTLREWADAAEHEQPDLAELHNNVLTPISALLDELVALAGDDVLPAADLCRWIEQGLAGASIGFPPPRLDSVLVTDIARGRHHEVAATLLLGLADDSWPPPARQGAYLSDTERARLGSDEGLLNGGAVFNSAREPYLALVACTRPTQRLWLSRPAADADGRTRAMSPFFDCVLRALQLTEQRDVATEIDLAAIATPDDLVLAAALAPHDTALQSAALDAARDAPDALRGLRWARERDMHPQLDPALAVQLLRPSDAPPEFNVRQLEDLGLCPFRHFGKHMLQLNDRAAETVGISPTRLWYRIMHATLRRLREQRYDWRRRDADALRTAALAAQQEVAAALALRGVSATHLLERTNWLLERVCAELLALPDGRAPELLSAGYGTGRALAPISLPTDHGEVRVRGHIGRVDATADGSATVVATRLRGESAVSWTRFALGADLALPAALLAVEGWQPPASGRSTATAPLRAFNAELQHFEPEWHKEGHAEFAAPSLRPHFQTNPKKNAELDDLLENTLHETRRILSELSTRALDGEIAASPLKHGQWTACSNCELRAVCRFDPAAGDAYRQAADTDAQVRDSIAAGGRTDTPVGTAGEQP